MSNPKVTVLLPAYNCAAHIGGAIESILSQTFSDFEFLIINDGSTDTTAAEIKKFHDPRIVYVENPGNKGLIFTLNRGLEIAKGKYLVRMDADDISLPERIAKQIAYLEANPEVGICGCWSVTFGPNIKPWETKYPENHEAIKVRMTFNTTLSHPTVVLNRELLAHFDLKYDPEFEHIEDYDLWERSLDKVKLANYPEVLFKYRVHDEQISSKFSARQAVVANEIRMRLLAKAGIVATPAETLLHKAICSYQFADTDKFITEVAAWFGKIYLANLKSHYFEQKELKHFYCSLWNEILSSSKKYSKAAILRAYLGSAMLRGWDKKRYLKLLFSK